MSEITEGALVELTRALVDRPTQNPPGNEGALVDHLIERLESSPVPFAVEVEEVAARAAARGGAGGRPWAR